MIKISHLLIFTSLLVTKVVSSYAQTKISLVRYDDDFTTVKNDTQKKGLENFKYFKFGKNHFISFGGELREQFQRYENLNFGDVPPTYSDVDVPQLWHRLMIHTDIELGNHFRFFIQLNNTAKFFNDNPMVPEIEEII